ncbi:MAG: hypothetical protein N2036_15920 [Bryobacteraceae bacterium]|nr:hypothetical protein [Bryobacteraceae bacterium]MCX7605562.1 hypothetical protein [Bryobacteraceae bacterium]
MTPIRPDLLRSLAWKQGAAQQRHYELRAGEETIAELDFLKTFGTLARGRTAERSWTFKRAGFLSPIVTARVEGAAEDCALYHPNFSASQGQLRLASGENYEFRLAGVWSRQAALVDGARREVFRLHLKGDAALGATVEVRLPETPEIGLLLLLTWYVLVLQLQDEALRAEPR